MTGERERPPPWVGPHNVALLTDLYQLTMVQAYWKEGFGEDAVFSLHFRRLPTGRNHLLACGLDDALRCLENLRFDEAALDFIASRDEFEEGFVEWLRAFRFTGDVYAVPEGTPLFPYEPILEVEAPIAEGQLAETVLMNQIHLQTVLASKAARVVEAARGRRIVDFGLRRMHGLDAGLKAARAFHIAGVDATSNVLAGQVYGVPIAGTMAHSYIQAHDSEEEAFRRFVELYPEATLLVDTYDTASGVRKVARLARELGDACRIRGVRLDSGDLEALARESRAILDAAGLGEIGIFASGGLDEYEIRRLLEEGAPLDGFGVGTSMGISADAPSADLAFKLCDYGGRGRLKLSSGKGILPGRKQVFREDADDGAGRAVRDHLVREGEVAPGRPLLRKVMERGSRLPAGREELDALRRRAREELDRLPEEIQGIDPASSPFPVQISRALEEEQASVARRAEREEVLRSE